MILRDQQVAAFAGAMMRSYEDRMVGHLRARFSQKLNNVEDPQLLELIRGGIDRARGYGIIAESDITRYLEYMVEYRPDFDISPETRWAHPILTDTALTGTAKMDRLDAYTTFEMRP